MDATGPLKETRDHNRYILVLQDVFTKFTVTAALPALTATAIAQVVIDRWILVYGPMMVLLTDNGREFKNFELKSRLADMFEMK